MINWELAGNPANWIIVALMLAIAVFGLRLISQYLTPGPLGQL